MTSLMRFFQPLGRALMLPIAVLPIAGLLLRLGQQDLVDAGLVSVTLASLFAAAGGAVFDNMGLLFAIGVAVGFARDGHGAASLAGVTCYVVAAKGAQVFLNVPPEIGAGLAADTAATVQTAWRAAAIHRFDVPLGIVSGLVGGAFYNRFSTITMPEYLAFFGGRRFVPIISGATGVLIAAVLGLSYGPLNAGVDALGTMVVESGGVGLFMFGLLNRLLVVTGLHHILNNIAYFVVGDWHGTTGDLRRFFAGDPSAGVFMSGFFPVMMFGLPAACLAMYHEAAPDRRKVTGGMLFSMALTSILTGVTEPIEFSFMFLAPLLYAIHAVLTGLAEVIMDLLGVRLGYSFSAGLIDYLLNYSKATRPLMLIPVGIVYALVYYGVFRFAIRRFNLMTPGRGPVEATAEAGGDGAQPVATARGPGFVAALGGAENLRSVAACTTRLRLIVEDQARIDEGALKSLGALAVIRPSAQDVQVVIGPIADAVAMEMQAALARPATATVAAPVSVASSPTTLPEPIAHAVGGGANIVEATRHPGRWRIVLRDPARLAEGALASAGVHAVARPSHDVVHLLIEDTVTA